MGIGPFGRPSPLRLEADDGQRYAKLMPRIPDKALLALKDGLEPREHGVEGVGQLPQLVLRAEVDSAREFALTV